MLNEITAALGGAKTAVELARGLIDLKTHADVQAKAIELQTVVLDLQGQLHAIQTAQMAEARGRAELEAKLRALREWSVNAAHYRLHRFEAGGMAYRFQPPDDSESAPHDLCAQCYEQKIKSILQACPPVQCFRALKCHRCGSEVLTERIPATVEIVPSSNRWRGF